MALGRAYARDVYRVARSVAQFALSGLLAVVVLGLIGVQILRATGRAEAVRDAKQVTALAGDGIVAPHLTPALLNGDPVARKRLDRLVRAQVLRDPVVRVKVWDSRARVLQCSPHRRHVGGIEPDPAHPLGAELRRQRCGAASVPSRDDHVGICSLDEQPCQPAPRLAIASQHQHGASVHALLPLQLHALLVSADGPRAARIPLARRPGHPDAVG